ncbi:(2Fe-2S)-binding protein [Halolamina sp.]|jgi:hypothetical protein|uniref:(2Fe-2S)-binding protein n=1 Tax=Halolamina sp. TaxID=1940283 RepID=UPI0026AB9CF8
MSEHEITMTVDGDREAVTVEARRLLVHALREQGYTAPNVGCESGKCGACTVELDGDTVKSCCLLAVQADGSVVNTVAGVEGAPEGLAATGGAEGNDSWHGSGELPPRTRPAVWLLHAGDGADRPGTAGRESRPHP